MRSLIAAPADLETHEGIESALRHQQLDQDWGLDGNDNFLPGLNRTGTPLDEQRVATSGRHLEDYLFAVEQLLNQRLREDPAFAPGVSIPLIFLGAPSEAECYCEFYSPNAIADVEGIRRAMVSLVSNTEWTAYTEGRVRNRVVGNGMQVEIKLARDLKFLVYAKQYNRIRMEVRYSGRLREHSHPRRMRGQPISGVDIMQNLRIDALRRTQNVLSGLIQHHRNISVSGRIFELITQIHAATGNNVDQSERLLAILATTGGLTPVTDDEVRLAQSLLRAGILTKIRIRHGNSDRTFGFRYALKPPFSVVAQHLANAVDAAFGYDSDPT